MVDGLPEEIRSELARLSVHAADAVAVGRNETGVIAVVVAVHAIPVEGSVRFQLPLSFELLFPLELLFLLRPPSSVELLLLGLTVLLIPPLLVLLGDSPLALLGRPRLIRTSLLGACLVVASSIIPLLRLRALVATLSFLALRRRLLVLILATAPVVSAALRLCRGCNEQQYCGC